MGFFDGVGSALVGGALSFLGGERANEASAQSVADQMAFQKESYQNRYQWQKQDMIKSGINPMLAYQSGAGPALSGSNYKAQDTMSPAVQSALAAKQNSAQVKNLNTHTKKLMAEEQAAWSNSAKMIAETGNLNQMRLNLEETYKQLQATTAKMSQQQSIRQTPAGKAALKLGTIVKDVSPFTSTFKGK
jgi:hypothetical protein